MLSPATSVHASIQRVAKRTAVEAHAFVTVARAGMLGLGPPRRALEIGQALRRFGPIGGGIVVAAIRYGERTALLDDRGGLSFVDLDLRSNALAHALAAQGVGAGSGIGIMCRNHRGFLDSTLAAAKAGARTVFLNTDFAGPQLRQVCAREGVEALIYDEEFTDVAEGVTTPKGRILAWTDTATDQLTLDTLIADGDTRRPEPPGQESTIVVLTSGTTGTPRGATRPQSRSLVVPGAVLSKIPFRRYEATLVAPPMYHAWGLVAMGIQLAIGSAMVLRRRFDPAQALDLLGRHHCTGMVVVPTMLRRILALGPQVVADRDLSRLRIIATGGSQLDGALASHTMDAFGDILYNVYGSTETSYATIATPADLRAAPGCAGRPPFGSTVRIMDDEGRPLPAGQTGRIFVGNFSQFHGYTGGGGKEVVDGLMSIGDVGHFDQMGRLFVDGRDDEMIVSGGENVFPREVEDLLASHDAVEEAAVVGVPDEVFGERLRAFVVLRAGGVLSADGVRELVRANLARHKVPRDVVFLAELPRNHAGKVLKRELRSLSPRSSPIGRHPKITDLAGSEPGDQ
ncbi:MAG TPA: AMP-binding protein [Mycobacteriales bacterium]|nr:AMP-binding protein [Mycobacteriales bacterium]